MHPSTRLVHAEACNTLHRAMGHLVNMGLFGEKYLIDDKTPYLSSRIVESLLTAALLQTEVLREGAATFYTRSDVPELTNVLKDLVTAWHWEAVAPRNNLDVNMLRTSKQVI